MKPKNQEIRRSREKFQYITKKIRSKTSFFSSLLELLKPEKSKRLRYIDVLVELHNTENLSILEMESEIKSRFLETHRISRIGAEQRVIAPQLPFDISTYDYLDYMNEHRNSGQVWLWMQVLDSLSTAA